MGAEQDQLGHLSLGKRRKLWWIGLSLIHHSFLLLL